ncbi:MAG: methionyl-tRNA formyltransferase, partial [Christensenellaceae bacterium]|nr:methionyl-tRNA formyltransferase [Christensenellaceae bacterium]
PMFKKGFGQADFTQPAWQVQNFIHGLNPAPGAYLFAGEAKVKLLTAKACPGEGESGTVLAADPKKGLIIACGEGALEITSLQYPGKKAMAAKDFLRGNTTAFSAGQKIEYIEQ